MKINPKINKGMKDEEIDELVENILSQMDLKDMIEQMSGKDIIKLMMEDGGIGFRAYEAAGSEKFGIPPFKFTDGPRGVIISNSTCFPVSMARGSSWDVELEERIGNVIGIEVRAHDGNLFGGVCINLLRHPFWGRSQETYGEDPYLLGELGAAVIRGVQKHNVMATAKHFAANSIENARFKVNVKMDERTLREVYLPHFKRCIKEGCASIMSAYNKLQGKFCGHNDHLLRDILKGEWNFQGFVHSDWMWGLKDTVGGMTGGLDVEMPITNYYSYQNLIKALKEEKITEEMIKDAARRVIRTIIRYTSKVDPQKYDKNLIGCEEHCQIALESAEKSTILLKNHDNTLPFNKNQIKSLAIIGRLADVENTGDHGSSNVRAKYIIPPLQGLQKYLNDTVKIIHNDGSNLKQAKSDAQNADAVILIVGYDYNDEGEHIPELNKKIGDRDCLSLHKDEIELIKSVASVNDKCVVSVIGGGAIIMEEWKDQVPAILMAWYSGMEGGTALARIIFGEVNPSGKLPLTIPKNEDQLPFFDKNADEIEYGYYHGYTLFDKKGYEAAFPFGFGLSYTTFEYSNLQTSVKDDKIFVSVDVENTGDMFGQEIVQLYVGFEDSEIDRPVKLLRGFKKVPIKKGESKAVKFTLKKDDLAYYNADKKSWEVENIAYKIYIGASSKTSSLLKANVKLLM
ncbi:MAG: beta-glucosidase family protein [Promethearchaeota archaeon]